MHTKFARLLTLVLLLVGATRAASSTPRDAPVSPPSYLTAFADVPLQLDGFAHSKAVGLNDRGQVLCSAWNDDGSPTHAFLWENGETTDLGSFTGQGATVPFAIDPVGRAVGGSVAAGGSMQAFVWEGGAMTALPLPNGYTASEAHAISSDGRIAGDVIDGTGHHAAVWQSGAVQVLPPLPGYATSRASGINSSGQVVGVAFNDAGSAGNGHAVLWQGGNAIHLGTVPGYSFSEANTINDSGVIGGDSFEPPDYRKAMVWQTGGMRSLFGIGTVLAINNLGWMVGQNFYTLRKTDFGLYATLFYNGYPYDLRLQIPDYRFIDTAVGINANAQIAANYGSLALLLTPIHPALSVRIDAPQSANVGQDVALDVTVTNTGPDTAINLSVSVQLDRAWEVERVTSSGGTVDNYSPYLFLDLPALPPGELHLSITARARAAGTLHASAGSHAFGAREVDAIASVTVPGVPAALLDGQVDDLEIRYPPPNRHGEPELQWGLTLINSGTAELTAGRYVFYLSPTPEPSAEARRLGSKFFSFPKLAPGDVHSRYYGMRFPRQRFPAGQYLLAVVDPTDKKVPESRIGAIFVSPPIPALQR